MDQDYRFIVIFALIVLGLFAGGLYYIFQENQNRRITMEYVQEYLYTNDEGRQNFLEQEIRRRIAKRPIALTSKASFGSFDNLISNGYACDRQAKVELKTDPLNLSRSYDEIWRDCMDNTELLPNQ